MTADFWKKFLLFLFPKSPIFRGVIDRTFTKFISAIATTIKGVHDYVSYRFLDVLPNTTTKLSEWSTQFNWGQTLTASKVAAEMKQQGGQTIEYIQQTLDDANFDLTVHEWFYTTDEGVEIECDDGTECDDGSECDGLRDIPSGYPTGRNPYLYISDIAPNNLLVNPVQYITGNYAIECDDGTECDDGSELSGLLGLLYFDKIYAHEVDYDLAPYYFYVGGETWPEWADVPTDRKTELLRLLYKIKPVDQRIVLLVNFTADNDYVYKDFADDSDVYKDDADGADVYKDSTGVI